MVVPSFLKSNCHCSITLDATIKKILKMVEEANRTIGKLFIIIIMTNILHVPLTCIILYYKLTSYNLKKNKKLYFLLFLSLADKIDVTSFNFLHLY